jgi:hypothetical protein
VLKIGAQGVDFRRKSLSPWDCAYKENCGTSISSFSLFCFLAYDVSSFVLPFILLSEDQRYFGFPDI